MWWIYLLLVVGYAGLILLVARFIGAGSLSEEDEFDLELYELLNRDR